MQLNTLKTGVVSLMYTWIFDSFNPLVVWESKNTYPHIEVFTDYNHTYFHEALGKQWPFLIGFSW